MEEFESRAVFSPASQSNALIIEINIANSHRLQFSFSPFPPPSSFQYTNHVLQNSFGNIPMLPNRSSNPQTKPLLTVSTSFTHKLREPAQTKEQPIDLWTVETMAIHRGSGYESQNCWYRGSNIAVDPA